MVGKDRKELSLVFWFSSTPQTYHIANVEKEYQVSIRYGRVSKEHKAANFPLFLFCLQTYITGSFLSLGKWDTTESDSCRRKHVGRVGKQCVR